MKPIQMHPASALVGLCAALAVFGLTSMVQTTRPIVLELKGPVRVEGIPTPQQMVRVVEGSPFTVPVGKLLVVTGTGATGWNPSSGLSIKFDGVIVLNTRLHSASGEGFGASSVTRVAERA